MHGGNPAWQKASDKAFHQEQVQEENQAANG